MCEKQIVIEYPMKKKKPAELFSLATFSEFANLQSYQVSRLWVIYTHWYYICIPSPKTANCRHHRLLSFLFFVFLWFLISVSVSGSLWFIKNSFNMRSLLTCLPHAGMHVFPRFPRFFWCFNFFLRISFSFLFFCLFLFFLFPFRLQLSAFGFAFFMAFAFQLFATCNLVELAQLLLLL